ncbi:MAG TPA: leucine--tRNA ligase [Anaerolineales bacterium]|nr:leucine--tRNA ligase [Anaerolineales bacterium]
MRQQSRTRAAKGKPHVERYVPQNIEPRWQARWEADQLSRATIDSDKPKFYFLTMLPYTSGNLHIGHWYAMGASDVRARYLRMRGFNVMFPIGFDAFGLPAENAAIERGIHPKTWTYANIDNMRRQLRSMGAMWDWSREVISSDPQYYRWTQWFFLKMFEHGLTYKKMALVDWCPKDNTTLAREQVIGDERVCERCGTPVVKKALEQWFFRITNYAEELLDFSHLDWPEPVRLLQTNWIGRSEGARVTFLTERGEAIEVFTTRPDTLWGATFLVLAPEHPRVEQLRTTEQAETVQEYVARATRQSEIEREAADKEKTGVFTGAYAVNPVNGGRIPVWIADYVLMTYGTGAIMAVPGHDQRDFDFALAYGLPILPVIESPKQLAKSSAGAGAWKEGFAQALAQEGIHFERVGDALNVTIPAAKADRYLELAQAHVVPGHWIEIVGSCWAFVFHDSILYWDSLEREQSILTRLRAFKTDMTPARTLMEMLWQSDFYRDLLYHDSYGSMVNSGPLTGTPADQAVARTVAYLEEKGIGKRAVNYHLRDWLISRQRYWGAPIPIIDCPEHGQVPVPEDQLPVLLPDDVEWLPTGESPLKLHPNWKSTTCPVCGRPAVRDTDTMDTFMCSSWYHLRYLSPHDDRGPFDPKEYEHWMPVNTYTGGAEHATMHLIYTRFFHKALRDMGITSGPEPMLQLRNQGQILGPDGQRMSKSRGNVIDPDEQVQKYGADVVRAYLLFGYRWAEGGPWSAGNIQGVVRWLNRVWTLVLETFDAPPSAGETRLSSALRRKLHQTVRQVAHDLETFEFNTVVSGIMELTNSMAEAASAGLGGHPAFREAVEGLLLMLAPITPHLAEELWARIGRPYSVHLQPWPSFDPNLAKEEEVTLVVQVNGKLRDRIRVPVDSAEEDLQRLALASEAVQRHLAGKQPRQVIVVRGRLVNIVV